MPDCILNIKFIQLILFNCFLTLSCLAQSSFSLPKHVSNLQEALQYLQQTQQLQYSCNSKLAKKCTVEPGQSFNSVREAIEQYLQGCQLTYKVIDSVYVIFSPQKKTQQQLKPNKYRFEVTVQDAESNEPLPFSTVRIGNAQLMTDENGQFSFQSKDSKLYLSVGHLGYYQYTDSIFGNGTKIIRMLPSVTALQTVTIKSDTSVQSVNLIEKTAVEKININSSTLIPSNTNNNIHAAIRLRPGIMAAGDQTSDYIIWGSYRGQSQVIFDGITMFSSNSIIEDIGSINPLVVRDIEIHKGGYQVELGDRVGGIVNILSKSGNFQSLESDLILSNQSVNGRLNIPFKNQSALQISLRSTFPNIFDPMTYRRDTALRYHFGDLNIKYDLLTKQGNHFQLSLLGNTDSYSEAFEERDGPKKYGQKASLNRLQLGASLQYHHNWSKWGKTKFSAAASYLQSRQSNIVQFDSSALFTEEFAGFNEIANGVSEYYLKAEHALPSTALQHLSFALGIHYNQSLFSQDSIKRAFRDNLNNAFRFTTYIKDKFHVNRYLSIEAGLKADINIGGIIKPFLQPRIDVRIKPLPALTFKLAWGLYNQYIAEYAFIDKLDNRFFFWDVPDNIAKSALRSMHSVAAVSFGHKYFNMKVEGYYKTTQNLTQFVEDADTSKDINIETGDARSYGIDVYLNTEFLGQKIWLTYSWANCRERFGAQQHYQRALHDQRHELKAAGLFYIKPIYFSLNYVYGSGLPHPLYLDSEVNIQPYSRLDAALMWRYKGSKVKLDIGVSVSNVLNTPNIQYNQYSSFPDGSIRFSSSEGIRPALFIHLTF